MHDSLGRLGAGAHYERGWQTVGPRWWISTFPWREELAMPRPVYLRTSEVARLLHVSPKTVSRWAKEGRLPYLATLGGHRRFPLTEIEKLRGQLSYLEEVRNLIG